MVKKKELIIKVLNEFKEFPTTTIKDQVWRKFGVEVSERSIQRVRKEMTEMDNENVSDEWDTGQEDTTADDGKCTLESDTPDSETSDEVIEVNNLNEMSDEEIALINMANEGGWSIQQLAENNRFTVDEIREVFIKFKNMVTGDVLDEENPNVYLTKGTQDILDELDALPGGQGGFVPKHLKDYAQDVRNNATTTVAPREDFWETEIETVKACSKCEKAVDVFMNITSRRKAMLYMKWAGAREWLAYLVGEKNDNGSYNITDLYLPDQRTSSTLVDKVDNDAYNQMSIVGVIHSHHEMGAGDADNPSFSGHDAAFINSNHNLSLLAGRDTVNKGFKIVGIARTKTPCGAFMQVKANIKSLVENPEADKALKDEFLEKTQTQGHTYVNAGHGQYGYGIRQLQTVHPVIVHDKRTYQPDASGVVQTRGDGFHFTK